jgi:transcriptional regulator with XRE-family HTH domain
MRDASKRVPIARIYAPEKQAGRPHYIQEWATKNGFRNNVTVAEAIGANKSSITEWYAGATPHKKNLEKLAKLFNCSVEELFRHPDEVRLSRAIIMVPPHKRDAFIAQIESLAAFSSEDTDHLPD